MSFPEKQYPHSEWTGQVIGSAQRVLNEVGCGLSEKIHENGLCVDFADQQIYFSQQTSAPVFYKEKILGKFIPDLVVADKVIVDAKVVDASSREHTAQILSYLKVTNLEVGLMLYFKYTKLEVRRVVNLKNSS